METESERYYTHKRQFSAVSDRLQREKWRDEERETKSCCFSSMGFVLKEKRLILNCAKQDRDADSCIYRRQWLSVFSALF
ncbi:hypothetical protein RJT34_04114 [Clitoria ternatea]|uniref:Uncharacterized protein n=1 Tax=Clitoria ternatea TaxID=43366 RepID=A0AAN9KNI0_CLITE